MENKWEYDYSNLYQNRPGDTSSYSTDDACGYSATGTGAEPPQGAAPQGSAPEAGAPTGPAAPYQPAGGGPAGPGFNGPVTGFGGPQPPRGPRPGSHKWATRVLCLVLAGVVGFGGGLLGSFVGGAGGNRVVYQTVDRTGSTTGGSVSAADTLSTAQVADVVSPSVVVITTEAVVSNSTWFGGQYVQSGAGSGVIMTSDGYILTCAHVVSGASSVKVTLADSTEYDATVVGADSTSDIAVLKIEAADLTPAVMGDSDALAVGEDVLAVGNPLGTLGGTVTNGIISALNREITVQSSTMTVIQTNAAVSPGNSGGGLFNAAGELIGIVNAKSTGDYAEGLGFAIPVNTALSISQDLIENGHVTGRPALGITVITISDAQTAAQYGVSDYGVYIAQVNEGGGAEAAGLQQGDMIVSVDNTRVTTSNELTDILYDHAVGDVLSVQVSRDRQLVTVDVTLGESTAG